MIYESSYWRDHLVRQARFLRDKRTQVRWTEASEMFTDFHSLFSANFAFSAVKFF